MKPSYYAVNFRSVVLRLEIPFYESVLVDIVDIIGFK